jgi:hypothetical protein
MTLLTLQSRILLEKPIDAQLVKKLPAFSGTERFIAMFTSQEAATGLSPGPDESSPHPHTPFP